MATETFDKTIWLDEKAAAILAAELEKPVKPHKFISTREEKERSAQEWLEKFRLEKLEAQSKKQTF